MSESMLIVGQGKTLDLWLTSTDRDQPPARLVKRDPAGRLASSVRSSASATAARLVEAAAAARSSACASCALIGTTTRRRRAGIFADMGREQTGSTAVMSTRIE